MANDDSEFHEELSDADWQRIAEAMAEADNQPASAFAQYVPQAKIIITAVNAVWGILNEKIHEIKNDND